jgi:secernin
LCDTLVALGNSTKDKSVIFGKNSDRPQNEVQLITYIPKRRHSKASDVKCTYISIPQISETAEVLLSQPWWMWGAEMGVNEYGVAIGNEAVFSHEPIRSEGLLGMDLLRLGLERGKTAKQALEIIIDLLEKYGQGGGCSYEDPSWSYHNSFIITDPKEAYVLETADEWWIIEEVRDVRSISNGLSIRGKGDLRRKGIIQHAINKGYCKDDEGFDFAATFSGSHISEKPSPHSRGGKSTILLKSNIGEITPHLMMEFLREHQAGICMHGGFESTGSQVSHLRKNLEFSVHWFTGSTLPCLSIYKPYTFPVKNQKSEKPGPYSQIDKEWFWSMHKSHIRAFNSWGVTTNREVYIQNLRTSEQKLISRVENLFKNESSMTKEEFLANMSIINENAWDYSLKSINH